jgi:hypothetical protein
MRTFLGKREIKSGFVALNTPFAKNSSSNINCVAHEWADRVGVVWWAWVILIRAADGLHIVRIIGCLFGAKPKIFTVRLN